MNSLSAAIVVFSGALCVAADVHSTIVRRSDELRWGLIVGIGVIIFGLVNWLRFLYLKDSATQS